MIIVKGEVRFGAGEIERLKPVFEANIAATRAEPGCTRYAYAVDISEPDLLHVAEEWEDQSAIDAHMRAPHMAELMGALTESNILAITINAYEGHFLKTLIGGPA